MDQTNTIAAGILLTLCLGYGVMMSPRVSTGESEFPQPISQSAKLLAALPPMDQWSDDPSAFNESFSNAM